MKDFLKLLNGDEISKKFKRVKIQIVTAKKLVLDLRKLSVDFFGKNKTEKKIQESFVSTKIKLVKKIKCVKIQ